MQKAAAETRNRLLQEKSLVVSAGIHAAFAESPGNTGRGLQTGRWQFETQGDRYDDFGSVWNFLSDTNDERREVEERNVMLPEEQNHVPPMVARTRHAERLSAATISGRNANSSEAVRLPTEQLQDTIAAVSRNVLQNKTDMPQRKLGYSELAPAGRYEYREDDETDGSINATSRDRVTDLSSSQVQHVSSERRATGLVFGNSPTQLSPRMGVGSPMIPADSKRIGLAEGPALLSQQTNQTIRRRNVMGVIPVKTKMLRPVGVQFETGASVVSGLEQISHFGPNSPALPLSGWAEEMSSLVSSQDGEDGTRGKTKLQTWRGSGRSTEGAMVLSSPVSEPHSSFFGRTEPTLRGSAALHDMLSEDSLSFVDGISLEPRAELDEREYLSAADERAESVRIPQVETEQVALRGNDTDIVDRSIHRTSQELTMFVSGASPDESSGGAVLSEEIDARLESILRVQEDRLKSMIKNLTYWLK